ncbi:cobalamin biosynthesis protein CobD [Bacillus lacus]|uniref:Cobalamin biosynthesis protein CobD n=1 Tax=Metabacillus lacus TaxID=1983721 RepID=A0A7X2IZU1_9BACI|nr:adenosylcobinamide-phosphate synthase CbiB [Metabacillus lacus]MRX72507.1 cobalamin biosynthesis protein CobD [Metabacillus lacus]
MLIYHLIALTLAVFIDLIAGDPPNWPHPVKWIGSLIHKLERKLNQGKYRRAKGTVMLTAVVIVSGGAALLLVAAFYSLHPAAGIFMEAMLISAAIAQKGLKEAALSVYEPLVEKDFAAARVKLSYIVGRDTELLGEQEIVRGAVETVAENTSDGITAPLFWALIGGAPLALIYRAVNTCDSMVGYKNEQYREFGWASAVFDDVVNWIPSRLTALCMVFSTNPVTGSRKKAWNVVRRDAKKHPSPNSGWGEAAVAALLGIQLGGLNYYKGIPSNRARMGDPLLELNVTHIAEANKIVTKTVPLFLIIMWLGGMLFEMARSWI